MREPKRVGAAPAVLLHVEPAIDADTAEPRLLLWLDVKDETVRVAFNELDARHLIEGTRASLEVFDELRDPD